MKKIVLIASLAVFSQFAAAAALTGGATGGSTSLTNTECAKITANETVKVQLSANVVGAYICNTTTAVVATGSSKGKGKVYTTSSDGGSVVESNGTATGATQGDVDAKAVITP